MRRLIQRIGARPKADRPVPAPPPQPVRRGNGRSFMITSARSIPDPTSNKRDYEVAGFYRVPFEEADDEPGMWMGTYNDRGVRQSDREAQGFVSSPELLPANFTALPGTGQEIRPIPEDDVRWAELPGYSDAGYDHTHDVVSLRPSTRERDAYFVRWRQHDNNQTGSGHYDIKTGMRLPGSAGGPTAFDPEMLHTLHTDAVAKPLRPLPAPAKPVTFIRTMREWNRDRQDYMYRVYGHYGVDEPADASDNISFTKVFGRADFTEHRDFWEATYDIETGKLLYMMRGVKPPERINLREAVKVLEDL